MYTSISDKDTSNPSARLQTAYEALKANPTETQRILSAAQKGENVGLAGIGALAAKRSQDRAMDAQKAQQAQQAAMNPQPTVLQQQQQQLQMAAQQGGIMGQLPNNIAFAQQGQQAPQGGAGLADIPVDPNALPQQMAGGGLVALAQGGYLDADGGLGYEPPEGYAHGGEVRGFDFGGWVSDKYENIKRNISDYTQNPASPFIGDEGDEGDSSELKRINQYYGYTEPSPSKRRELEAMWAEEEGRGGRNGEIPLSQQAVKNAKSEVAKEARKVDKDVEKTLRDDAHLAERALPDVDYGRGVTKMVSQEGARSPEAEEQIQEARDLRQAEQAPVQQGGLPAIQAQEQTTTPGEGDIMALIDKIKTARGVPAAMSQEERAWREEKAKDANTEKWLQTLTGMAGGLFAGGGRNWPEAIGQGALYGLSAYRQGAAAESEAELSLLNRQAQVQEAQRKAQEEAANEYFSIMKEQGKLGSAESIARSKVLNDRTLAEYRAQARATEGALNRAAHKENALIGAEGRGQADYYNRLADADAEVERRVEALRKEADYVDAAGKAKIRAEVYAQYGLTGNPGSLGGGQGLAGGQGLGNPTVTRERGIQYPASS